MGRSKSIHQPTGSASGSDVAPARLGSQTLFRGLDVIEVVAAGPIALASLAERLGLTRSTTHRLASALADRRYLTFVPRSGYTLGPKLLELGYKVRDELDLPHVAAPHLEWLARMRTYAKGGYAFDLEENEDQIRCVAAPIRDVAGRIIAAISVSSAAQYMSDQRMQALTKDVIQTAHRISEDLGWTDGQAN